MNGGGVATASSVHRTHRLICTQVDDQEIYLQVFEGEDHMKKIEAFCMQYMADSSSSCVTQLTPHVEKKL